MLFMKVQDVLSKKHGHRHWHRHDATGDTATSILEKLGHGTVGIWQLIINIYL